MLRHKRVWIGVALSLVLIIYVFYQTDPAKIWNSLLQAQYAYLVPALLLYFVGVGVRAVRWHFLLRDLKPIPTGELFRTVVIGYMANDILPARMGELVRAFVLGQQERISKAATLVTILVERIFDGLTMLTFIVAASFLLHFGDEELTLRIRLVSAIFVAAILALAVLAGMPRQVERIVDLIVLRLPARFHARVTGLVQSFIAGLGVLRSPRNSFAVFAFSILAWLCETGMYATLAQGFGISLRFAVYLLAAAFANLVTIAPSTPGYVGVFDAPIVSTLTTFGIERNLATSYTIVLHAALILPVTLLGFYYAARAGMTLTQITRVGGKLESVPKMQPRLE
jgi:glycosyltransferase 2 family protein